MDQILGPDLSTSRQAGPGLSGNVTFVPTDSATDSARWWWRRARPSNLKPCNVGYMYDIKASALDVAIRSGLQPGDPLGHSVKVVAEGQDFFTPTGG